jgi:hypothetical protein
MNMKKQINEILEEADTKAKTWLLKTQSKMSEKVEQLLDTQFENTILKVFGFNNHWGDWEVDHCNGRSGESNVGDWIKKHAEKDFTKWIEKNVKRLPKIPPKAIESLKKDYQETLLRRLREYLYTAAEAEAKQIIDKYIKERFIENEVRL